MVLNSLLLNGNGDWSVPIGPLDTTKSGEESRRLIIVSSWLCVNYENQKNILSCLLYSTMAEWTVIIEAFEKHKSEM